jgi:hypothetical protein
MGAANSVACYHDHTGRLPQEVHDAMITTYTLGKQLITSRHTGWRSLYPVYENGILLAFLGMQSGWGRSWIVYPLRFASGTTGAFEGFQPYEDTYGGRRRVNSKEAFADAFTGGLLGPEFGKRKDFKTAPEMIAARDAAASAERQRTIDARETFRKAFKEYEARVALLEELRAGRVDTPERVAILDGIITESRERMFYMSRQISNADKALGENQ